MRKFRLLVLGTFVPLIVLAKAPAASWMQSSRLVMVGNKGQIHDQYGAARNDIQYRIQNGNVNVFIGNGQLHYQWSKPHAGNAGSGKEHVLPKADLYRMDVTLTGADPHAEVIAEDMQSYTENYYTAGVQLQAASYRKITYKNVYPSIDWVLYIKNENGQDAFEYDFVVHPGGKVSDIQLKYGGTSSLSLDKNGGMSAVTPMGTVSEEKPYAYLLADDGVSREPVSSAFSLRNNTVSFNTGVYNQTLVIDPTVLWGTYYGGQGFDLCTSFACDNTNSVYIAGSTFFSGNIATTGAYQTISNGDFDGFIAKFNSAGAIQWATFYGGAGDDNISGMTLDVNNNVYVSGITNSTTGMGSAGSYQDTLNGVYFDNFLAKFSSSGSRIWSTYYGGTDIDEGGFCAADNYGHIYLSGFTASNNGIANAGFQNTYGGGANDGFLVQFDTAGTRHWATYYGNTGDDDADGVACDTFGNVYLGGHTNSTAGIASTGSFQGTYGGGATDNFLVKFDMSGARKWATYYGGSNADINGGMHPVTCDKAGNVYFNGKTNSASGIATAGSWQSALSGQDDAFLAKFDSTGVRKWATYYGDTLEENAQMAFVNEDGNIWLTGFTTSTVNMASPGAYQSTYGGGTDDAFIVKFDTAGTRLWASYFGGTNLDECYAAGHDKAGNVFITGGTGSPTGIATPGSYLTTYYGGAAVFLEKFCTAIIPGVNQISGKDSICSGSAQVYSVDSVSGATAYIWSLPSGWTGSSTTDTIHVTASATGGAVSVRAVRCNDTSSPRILNVNIIPPVPAIITVNGFVLGTVNAYNAYQWYLNGVLIPGATSATYTVTQNGDYTVKGSYSSGCTDSSAAYTVSNVSVSNVQLSNAIMFYPNPAVSILHIIAPAAVNVTVSSIDGKEIMAAQKARDIDVSSLAAGMYMIQFSDDHGTYLKTEKLIKIKQ
ncbi:SBBP repeat-containing protein [Chitinophagaceae bacterium MMS25-I14]